VNVDGKALNRRYFLRCGLANGCECGSVGQNDVCFFSVRKGGIFSPLSLYA